MPAYPRKQAAVESSCAYVASLFRKVGDDKRAGEVQRLAFDMGAEGPTFRAWIAIARAELGMDLTGH